jgi:hypothetical protein
MQLPAVAWAKPNTTIPGLSNAGTQIDGQTVTFQGEAVGDIINADEGHKWLTLEDEGSTISVYVTDYQANRISHLGRYDQRGSFVEVTGTFHAACPIHDGLTDVHADRLTVLDAGEELESELDFNELKIGGVLLAIGLLLLVLQWRLRERLR